MKAAGPGSRAAGLASQLGLPIDQILGGSPGSTPTLLMLDEHDLAEVVRNIPGLARRWADLDGVPLADLAQGKGPALTKVRSSIMRDPQAHAVHLAQAGVDHLRSAGELAAVLDDDSPADDVAKILGTFGAKVSPIFCAAFIETLERDSAALGLDVGDPALIVEGQVEDGPIAPRVNLAVSDDEQDDPSRTTGVDQKPVASADRVAELLKLASSLSADLVVAADVVERGEVPNEGLPERLQSWTAQARLALEEGPEGLDDLATLASRLAEDAIAAAEADAAAAAAINSELAAVRDVLTAVEALEVAGVGEMAIALVRAKDFASVADLKARVTELTRYQSAMTADTANEMGSRVNGGRPDRILEDLQDEETGARTEPDQSVLGVGDVAPVVDETAPRVERVVQHPETTDSLDRRATTAKVSIRPGRTPSPSTVEAQETREPDNAASSQWDDRAMGAVARLVFGGREALAVHQAVAAGADPHMQDLLRLAAAAFSLSRESFESQLVLVMPTEDSLSDLDVDRARLLLAALVRAGLVIGYPPTALGPVMDAAQYEPEGPLGNLLVLLIDLVQRGQKIDDLGEQDAQDLSIRWSAIASSAASMKELLANKTIKFHRSTKVLRHLVKSDQPIGSALDALVAVSAGSLSDAAGSELWGVVESVGRDASNPDRRSRMISMADRAVSTNQQLREDITAGALKTLESTIGSVGDLLTEAVAVQRAFQASANRPQVSLSDDWKRLLADVPEPGAATSIGDAAIERLVGWLRSRDDDTPVAGTMESILDDAVLGVFEIPRDGSGRPSRPATKDELDLLDQRTTVEMVRGYLAADNIQLARDCAVLSEQVHDLEDEIARAAKAAQDAHRKRVSEVENLASRLRAVHEDDLAREITTALEPHRDAHNGRYDLAADEIGRLFGRGETRLADIRLGLEDRARAVSSTHDRKRILDLIESGDEVLASEFLTRAESGELLPHVESSEHDDFGSFFPGVVETAAAAAAEPTVAVDAVRMSLGVVDDPTDRQLLQGLAAWRSLQTSMQSKPELVRPRLAEILRMVGLVPQAQNWVREVTKTKRSGYATFQVRANATDTSYVPFFGTQAHGSYDVTMVWDTVSPSKLMSFIDDSRHTNANIVLYFGTMSVEHRLELRRLTMPGRGKGFSPLVIDEAVVGWLSTRREPSFRVTQRVTLPFTTLNPYTPFAGGEVPDEVFVGRDAERQKIVSPTGSMFVYGGRQLGKSALLRRVERLFTDLDKETGNGSVAVYIDLKAASIGEALEPSQLWPVLRSRLVDKKIVSPKTGRDAGVEEISGQILRWLRQDESNRMLLLLDESDNFLTADSKAGRSDSVGSFPTLQSLKAIMEESKRRFKPVFAGLHQVQRFHDTSNTPIAHGGEDILIGPLSPIEARSLVVEPMAGLGYEFENQEAVWRLLLYTNYQASLVQIICEALNKHLQARSLPPDGGRIIITGADVDAVYATREVRQLIEQRFRWTINLDSRYRLIALVVALRTLDAVPGTTFTPTDLHEECAVWWPDGFAPHSLSTKEFKQYLDEMIGLGVLHRSDDRFVLRSPSIIGLLGTREALNRELAEASSHLELDLEYNASMNRRIIGTSSDLSAPRSPLPDQDLSDLTELGGESARIRVVVGTEALGIATACTAIKQASDDRDLGARVVAVADLDAEISRQQSNRAFFIIDLSRDETGRSFDSVVAAVSKRPGLTVVIVATPDQVGPCGVRDNLQVVRLRRWTIEGLRAWQDSPFSTPELRERLHRVTTGWPDLVQRAISAVEDGSSPEDAMDAVDAGLAHPTSRAQVWRRYGADEEVVSRWVSWFGEVGEDGLYGATAASLDDLDVAIGGDAREILDSMLDRDLVEERPDGWVLNRAVAACKPGED